MCGIFGYIGKKNAGDQIISGLKRLEYRGYDSWGIAVQKGQMLKVAKRVGKISDLASSQELELPVSRIGIGHTRWATHGGVTEVNAHPHFATDNSFVLAQNGIIQNFDELKIDLAKKGYQFLTETDTEVIVRLIEEKRKTSKLLREAVREAFLTLEGRNTIILLSRDKDEIIAARNGSPLVIGLNEKTGEIFFSSDTLSFAPSAQKMIVIENGQLVHFLNGKIHLFDLKTGKEIDFSIEDINISDDKVDKEGFDHFMLKEIYEQPFVITQVTKQDKANYQALAKAITQARTVYTVGSGTAGIAAAQAAYYLRKYGKINAISLVGADALEYFDFFSPKDLIIAPSQSGETADVLEVLEVAQQKGMKIASYVNMVGSTMTRIADYKFLAQAGPEICVMSTKVFVSQLSFAYLVAKTVAGKYDEGKKYLEELSLAMTDYLSDKKTRQRIENLATKLRPVDDIFLMGKGQNFQIMREGMVKLIEGSYKHAHALPAGDLKHYAITLIEKDVPVIVALSEDESSSDTLNAANEVKARGATVIGISEKTDKSFDYFLQVKDTGETSSILHIVPLQLLAYYITVLLNNNVDKPRNIAKSVTVK